MKDHLRLITNNSVIITMHSC